MSPIFSSPPSPRVRISSPPSSKVILVSEQLLLAFEPFRQIGNSDAVGFAESDCREFARVDCPANLFIVSADEFCGLFDCDRDWLDQWHLRNSHDNPLGLKNHYER